MPVILCARAVGLVLVRMPLVRLSGARLLFVARAADVHEQRKPWVPLMLELSYRPKGWLGIMLGSRLYYEFTEAALGNDEDWERVADSVAREVRRHGAPLPSAGPAAQAVAETARAQEAVDDAAPAVAVASTVPTGLAAVRPAPTREAAGGVSVSSVAHNSSNHASNYSTTDISVNNNNNNTNNTNIGNASIVLL